MGTCYSLPVPIAGRASAFRELKGRVWVSSTRIPAAHQVGVGFNYKNPSRTSRWVGRAPRRGGGISTPQAGDEEDTCGQGGERKRIKHIRKNMTSRRSRRIVWQEGGVGGGAP